MNEGQRTCCRLIYSFLNCLFVSPKGFTAQLVWKNKIWHRNTKLDFFSRLNLDSANEWISWITIIGAQQIMNPKTAVTSVLETFASLRKLFAYCNFDNVAWLWCQTNWSNSKFAENIINAASNEDADVVT